MTKLRHKFVEFIPDTLETAVLYVSIAHGTAVHRCCCNCGREVVTPLTPTDWKVIFDGESVSLYPSIGNWNFPCRSHYWISHNRVEWAEDWSDWRVEAAITSDRNEKDRFYGKRRAHASELDANGSSKARSGFWPRLFRLCTRGKKSSS